MGKQKGDAHAAFAFAPVCMAGSTDGESVEGGGGSGGKGSGAGVGGGEGVSGRGGLGRGMCLGQGGEEGGEEHDL